MKIRFLIMDVDGTLTDGKIYMGEQGELMKAFNIKDGCGMKDILPQYGILPVIITGRQSKILERRCAELGITSLSQGIRDKLACLDRLLKANSALDGVKYTYANCAYIGDDLSDLPCIVAIKEAGGVTACPADSAAQILAQVDYICTKNGGDGAVRELIDRLAERE